MGALTVPIRWRFRGGAGDGGGDEGWIGSEPAPFRSSISACAGRIFWSASGTGAGSVSGNASPYCVERSQPFLGGV